MRNKTKDNKLVIFESIRASSIPAIFFYIKKNYKIKYFTIDSKIENKKWFKSLLARYDANEIDWADFDLNLQYLSHNLALENIEQIYKTWFEYSKLIHQMISLLNSDITQNVYKKDLVMKLQTYYQICTQLNHIAETTNNSIIFVPSAYIQLEKITKTKLNSKIYIPFWSRICVFIRGFIKKIIYVLALCFLPLWTMLWKTRKIVLNTPSPKEYQVGIRVYRTDLAFRAKNRTIDFVLDGEKVNKDNSLFCLETDISEDYMQKLMVKKYNVVELQKILYQVNLNFIYSILIKKIMPCCLKSSYLSIYESTDIIETTIGVLYKYITWKCFAEKYSLKHFVVYNNFEKYHIIRNIILSQNGVQTWYYLHSTHFVDLFTKLQDNVSMRHVIFAYLYYDNLITWGNKSSLTFICLPNSIVKHQKLGCFWSEHARMLIDGEISSDLKEIAFNKMKIKPVKIIGIFDTTFGKSVPLQINDMLLFVKGLLKLLQNNPDIGIIIKEKKAKEEMLAACSDISCGYDKLYNILQSHERCYSTGWTGDPSEIIAISDLIISACFTSTTSEALGARKKAIFFDASNRFKGLYYDKFPKMVAHGFDELDKFVKYWLYEVSDAMFDEYIDNYVIDELDSYADGRAITRFRELLSEEKT